MSKVTIKLSTIIAVCQELYELESVIQPATIGARAKVTIQYPMPEDRSRFSEVKQSAGLLSGEVLTKALRSRGTELIEELKGLGVDTAFLEGSLLNQKQD